MTLASNYTVFEHLPTVLLAATPWPGDNDPSISDVATPTTRNAPLLKILLYVSTAWEIGRTSSHITWIPWTRTTRRWRRWKTSWRNSTSRRWKWEKSSRLRSFRGLRKRKKMDSMQLITKRRRIRWNALTNLLKTSKMVLGESSETSSFMLELIET